MSRTLSRWLPPVVSWPLALVALVLVLGVTSDRLVIRRLLNSVGRSAQERNLSIFPGTVQPWEPERSGSPWSHEPWYALGSQGRALVSGGPRARDIRAVTGHEDVREPIRIYVACAAAGIFGSRPTRCSAKWTAPALFDARPS